MCMFFSSETPTIKQVEDVIIEENQNLTLMCEGELPIIWRHSYSLSFLSKQEVIIEVATNRKEDGSLYYESSLFIQSAQFDFTGTFSCLFLKYNSVDDPSLETSVYVFVSSEGMCCVCCVVNS